ncbi:glycosyltransferase [Cytobacillus firmus]|uniref:glycosyltransferase n=1 Tax=Cytobacillus firmus TaxID=1399 RepID=UPI0030039605
MIKILLVRSENAFLPEIDAYVKYFNKLSHFSAFDSSKIDGEYSIDDFDVIWEFKGIGGLKRKDKIIIHEYASLSVGTLPSVKNYLKTKLNPIPNLRVFLNEEVKKEFKFRVDVDHCIRDMGIDESFLGFNETKKEYDFVYVGSISKEREIDVLLNKYVESLPGKLCLIGDVEDDIYKRYKGYKDITFTGKLSYNEVPEVASKAIYGINFIPNKYPYNKQTSTKLLEYLTLGLKVITTDYQWIRTFEDKHGCSFYKLSYNNLNFNIIDIKSHNYISEFIPQDFLWEKVIGKSGIGEKILNMRGISK